MEGCYLALFVVLKLFRRESATHPEALGGGGGEAPGWGGLEKALETVASHRAIASSTLRLQVFLTGSGLYFSWLSPHPFSLLQHFICFCTSGMAFPGVIKCVILLPQVITSLWSHTHFLLSLPLHPKHHPTSQDNGTSTAPWAKTSL